MRRDAAKRLAVFGVVLPVVFQFVASGLDWDDDDMLRAVVLGPLNGLFMVRDVSAGLWDFAAGNPIFDSPGLPPPLSTMGEIQTAVAKVVDKWNAGDWTFDDDFWKIIKSSGTAVGNLAGMPVGPVSRLVGGAVDVAEGNTVAPVRRAMGFSEARLDEANREYLALRRIGLARKETDPVLYRAVTAHDARRTALRKSLKSLQEKDADRDQIAAARRRIQEANRGFVKRWESRV